MNDTHKILGFEWRPFFTKSLLPEPYRSIEVVSILLNGHCNFGCSYCKRGCQFKGENGSITTSYRVNIRDVYDFIDHESMDAGKMFRISGGEPAVMRYPLFKEIMEHAKLRGIFRSVATNMSLPDRVERMLLENDIEYLAGDFKASPRYWNRVTGMPGRFIENVIQSWNTWGEFSHKTPAECRIMVFPFTTWDDVAWIMDHLDTTPIIVLRGFRRVDYLTLESTSSKHMFQLARKVNQEYNIPTIVRMKWNKGTYLVNNEEIMEA